MTATTLSTIATVVTYGIVALGGIGGIWAMRRLGREPISDRRDHALAGRVIAVAFVAGWLALFGLAQRGGNPVGGPAILIVGALLGVATGAFAALCSALGYVLMARTRLAGLAIAGAIVAPVVLGGALKLSLDWKQGLSYAAYQEESQASRKEGARVLAAISASVIDARATTFRAQGADGSWRELVESVRLTLVVHADRPITLHDGEGSEPRAWFFPDAAQASGFDVRVPIDAPFEIPAGDTTFVIEDRWPDRGALITWPAAPQPGPWSLRFSFTPPGVQESVFLEVKFVLTGAS
jgi:hypothetical protein